jgi:hypothetical protein
MKQSSRFSAVAFALPLSALTGGLAFAAPVGGWYPNSNTNGTLINGSPGEFRYVLGPGGNSVLADVGPYPLTVGGSLTFSGTVTNNVSTLLWNDIQFRWGILDSNGNPFHGISGIDGDYTNYHGYWAGNPNNNPHPVYELTDTNRVWVTVSGVTGLGAGTLATGSAASSPPLGVYAFSIAYQRLNPDQMLVTADLNHSQVGTYSYQVSAIDSSASTWVFDRVGLFFNPGVNTTGALGFGNLEVSFDAAPLIDPNSLIHSSSGFSFSWRGPSDQTFQVEYSNVLPPVWITFTNIITSTNGVFYFTDDGVQTGGFSDKRFYRLRQ